MIAPGNNIAIDSHAKLDEITAGDSTMLWLYNRAEYTIKISEIFVLAN